MVKLIGWFPEIGAQPTMPSTWEPARYTGTGGPGTLVSVPSVRLVNRSTDASYNPWPSPAMVYWNRNANAAS